MSSDHNHDQSDARIWLTLTTHERVVLLESAKRNDSCPCGSGKKFKACHIVRVVPIPKQVLTFPGREIPDAAAMIEAGVSP